MIAKIRTKLCFVLLVTVCLSGLSRTRAFAQDRDSQTPEEIIINGRVQDEMGEPIGDAVIVLQDRSYSPVKTQSNADGSFRLSSRDARSGVLTASKAGFATTLTRPLSLLAGDRKHVTLVLKHSDRAESKTSKNGSAAAGQFHDEPDFVVAGLIDGTNFGGHGSETTRRTSEALTASTVELKKDEAKTPTSAVAPGPISRDSENVLRRAVTQDPQSFQANHQLGDFLFSLHRYREAIPLLEAAYRLEANDYTTAYELARAYEQGGDLMRAREQVFRILAKVQNAELHHLLADLDERVGDYLGAVREYEDAARIQPNDVNYFDWGTELLLHGASQASAEVFGKGVAAHPGSARMLIGLGASLYALGSYDEAARKLCAASDLNPAEAVAYIFLGKMEQSAPEPLACAKEKLARFAHEQPENAVANYYYAMSLWKSERGSENPLELDKVTALLGNAVRIDSNFAEAYLALGNVYSSRGNSKDAIYAYQKALTINPRASEVHYRLGIVYKRLGEQRKAQEHFQVYEQIDKAESASLERQRRDLRQYLVKLKNQ
jgi:tetratricopeptide (TPR) repeat protein